jgi:hypothetical protein
MKRSLRYNAWKAVERMALAMSGAFIAIHVASLGVVFLTIAEDALDRARKVLLAA